MYHLIMQGAFACNMHSLALVAFPFYTLLGIGALVLDRHKTQTFLVQPNRMVLAIDSGRYSLPAALSELMLNHLLRTRQALTFRKCDRRGWYLSHPRDN